MIKDFHIIIVTFNRKNFLKNCIKSIINQKNVSIYLDIIDNGSSDGTREYLSNEFKFTKKNLVINTYILENNIDPVIAITTTISAYKGRIINFIGDDDWLCKDNILYEIKEIFKNNSYDCSSVFTLFKKINLYNHEENFIFTKTNKELMSFDKKLIKKLNFYEVIYSQVIQWRLTIISKLNKKLLKNSHKFYKNIRYHSSATFFSKKQLESKSLFIKEILSRPFGDIGFLKILTQGSKNILYENFCLCIGVPIIRETNMIKKPKANSRLNSYLKLSLKDNDSLEIPLFSIICTNQFIWEVNRLKNGIRVKRGKQFLFARSFEIIMKRFTTREKFSFLIELWNFKNIKLFIKKFN